MSRSTALTALVVLQALAIVLAVLSSVPPSPVGASPAMTARTHALHSARHPRPRHTPLPPRPAPNYKDPARYAPLIAKSHGTPIAQAAASPIDLTKLPRVKAAPRRSSGLSTVAPARVVATTTPPPSTTGIWPWWTYQSRDIPGVGAAMANVVNLNFLFLESDVDISAGGLDLGFERVYNSQSGHDATNDDGSTPSVYGNRWTNNLDVHLGWASTGSNTGIVSVYTADGARDDYTCETDTAMTCASATAGIHDLLATTQVTGGVACQLQWTLKSGVSYVFNAPYPACSNGAGQYGRLLAIYGRNANFSIQLAYSWNPDASNPENLTQITATHQPDGTQLLLTFGIVTGSSPAITELMSVTRPDGVTINYHYGTNGDLADVDKPRNTPILPSGETVPSHFLDGAPIAAGNVPQTYAKQTGNIEVCGPRAAISIINTNQQPTDGACADFDFNPNTHQLFDWYTRGVLNPTPGDNVSPSPIQADQSTAFKQWDTTWFEPFPLNCSPMTDVSDIYGHDTQYCYDSSNRVTQVWALVTGLNYLTTSQTWDINNNRTSITDARGYTTNIAYDANGNALEVALPSQSSPPNSTRPTSLFDYDSHNNVVSYCDPANNANNVWNPSPGPTPCSGSGSTYYSKFTYAATDANESYGCLTSTAIPSGYSTQIAYNAIVNPLHPCGIGLPYQIKPATYVQLDGTTRNATETYTYNAAGNVRTYTKNYPNGATWQIGYTQNGMHTVYSVQDPDGVTSYRCYNLDESLFYSESPIQNKFDSNYPNGPPCPSPSPLISGATPPPYAVAYGYDADGDSVTEVHHHGCTNPNASPAPTPCPAISAALTKCNDVVPVGGTTCDFYDGLDRLVEVKLPYDPNTDLYKNPWITRYLYDLDGTPKTFQGDSYNAFGNLFKIQELLTSSPINSVGAPATPGSIDNGAYVATKGIAYDGLDRTQAQYATDGSRVFFKNLIWDTTPINNDDIAGLLGQVCNATPSPSRQCENFDYYPDGQLLEATSNDNSSPERDYSYDFDSRPTTITQDGYSFPQIYTYDVDGNLATAKDAAHMTSGRATLTYNLYPDGTTKSLDVSSNALSRTALFSYSYRNDGPLQTEQIDDTGVANIIHHGKTTLSYRYTDAGRLAGRSETGVAALPSPAPQTTILYQTNPPTGLVNEQDTPVGNLTSITYTAEGEVAQVISTPNPHCYFVGSQYTYSIRGELIVSPQCSGGAPNMPYEANGLSVQINNSATGQLYSWNNLMAVMTDIIWNSSCGQGSDPPPCESTWSYDFAGRLTSQQAPKPYGTAEYNVTATYSYDAEDHLLTTQLAQPLPHPTWFENTAWGPNGHPIQIGTFATPSPEADERLHWNGDQLLFTTNQTNGLTLDDIKIDVQGDILPQDNGYNDLTFYDRGPGGNIIGCHNATGTGYVGLTDSWLGFPLAPCPASPSPGPTGVQMPTSTMWEGSPFSGTIGLGTGRTIGMPRTDGFVDGMNTIQGIRAYDSAASLWTTPDRFEGWDMEPTSQKSYMWNENNPMNNLDPTGTITMQTQPPNNPSPPPPPSQGYMLIWGRGSSAAACIGPCHSLAEVLPCPAHACMMAPQKGKAKQKCDDSMQVYKEAGGDVRDIYNAISPKVSDLQTSYAEPQALTPEDQVKAERVSGAVSILGVIEEYSEFVRLPLALARLKTALSNVERDCLIPVPSSD